MTRARRGQVRATLVVLALSALVCACLLILLFVCMLLTHHVADSSSAHRQPRQPLARVWSEIPPKAGAENAAAASTRNDGDDTDDQDSVASSDYSESETTDSEMGDEPPDLRDAASAQHEPKADDADRTYCGHQLFVRICGQNAAVWPKSFALFAVGAVLVLCACVILQDCCEADPGAAPAALTSAHPACAVRKARNFRPICQSSDLCPVFCRVLADS